MPEQIQGIVEDVEVVAFTDKAWQFQLDDQGDIRDARGHVTALLKNADGRTLHRVALTVSLTPNEADALAARLMSRINDFATATGWTYVPPELD